MQENRNFVLYQIKQDIFSRKKTENLDFLRKTDKNEATKKQIQDYIENYVNTVIFESFEATAHRKTVSKAQFTAINRQIAFDKQFDRFKTYWVDEKIHAIFTINYIGLQRRMSRMKRIDRNGMRNK